MPQIKNGILVVTADTHTNSMGGLMRPTIRLISGNVVRANAVQRLLWRGWIKSWAVVEELKKQWNLPLVTVFNGDTVDKNKHDPWDRISHNPNDVLKMAGEALEPALAISDSYYFTKGTKAHTEGWFEDKLAQDLGCPDTGNGYAHQSLLLSVGGQTYDIRHQTESNSTRPYTLGGGAMRSSEIVQSAYYKSGDKPPDWAVRNHVHHFEDGGRNRLTRAVFLPCWQAPSDFVHRIGLGVNMPEFGLGYWVCKDGLVVEWDLIEVPVKRSRPMAPEVMR